MPFIPREVSRSVLSGVIGGALLFAVLPASVLAQTQPNILLILLDDVGIENLDFYGIGTDPDEYAATENLTDFAAGSRVFFDAWSTPLCSPTRALIMTGRHGFRTGLGGLIPCDEVYGLDTTDTLLLAKQLKSAANFGQGESTYATAAFGKWHLGKEANEPAGCEGLDTPIDAGFDLYDGWFVESYGGDPWSYSDYIRTRITPADVLAECDSLPIDPITDGYQTSQMTTRMITWITAQESEPWFVYAAYSAAHFPLHCPDEGFYNNFDFGCNQGSDARTKYLAMIKAFDLDFGRLLEEITLSDTLVIVVSDNGSPTEVAVDPVDPNRAKGTIFQGGIRVPLIIGGWGLEDDEIEGGKPVGLIDLYATILGAAGATLPDECELPTEIGGCTDSVDLSPYFTDTDPDPLPRTTLYTEWFYPNFEPGTGAGPTLVQQAIRNTSYKFLQATIGLQGLFHISPDDTEDPWEDDNLISSTVEQDMTTLAFLQDELLDLTGGSLLDLCDAPFAKVGESCMAGTDCCSRFCSSVTLKCVNPFPPQEPGCP